MKRVTLAVLMGAALAAASVTRETGAAAQGSRPAGATYSGRAFQFTRVADGIYLAVGTGVYLAAGTGVLSVVGNSAVIVNDADVVVVDDHVSPAAAWALVQEVKTITDKPVRTVVNTHFHFDHAHGNQIFGPEVAIIGHEFTRRMLLGGATDMPLYRGYLAGIPRQVDDLRARVGAEADPVRRAALDAQLRAAENNRASQAELEPTPPDVTLQSRITLHRGDREIQIRFLGRGHTAGDVVVFLPRERVVITGDLLTASLSNMSDAFVNEWVATLDALKALEFDTVLPGHGAAFTDRAKIDYFQAYLRDVWEQVSRLKAQGVPAEEAAKRADLTRHRERFPNIQGPGVPLIGVARIYELLGP